LNRALASNVKSNFMKVVASSIVDKYIGESARVIREMFSYAKAHQPCIIFIDEIDAIGGRRFSEGSSSDREIQRTLMELLGQMDGFDEVGQVTRALNTGQNNYGNEQTRCARSRASEAGTVGQESGNPAAE
jgi:26S proteasome regulatory subunit T4